MAARLALGLVVATLLTATVASESAVGRTLQVVPAVRANAAASGPCFGVRCPDTSSCRVMALSAACVCPPAARNMIPGPTRKGKCVAAPLPHADYLNAHNYVRAALGLNIMTWSQPLATSALAWSRVLVNKYHCEKLEHTPNNPYGQNLAYSYGQPPYTNDLPVKMWVAEIADYSCSRVPSGCKPGKMCGHYTQVVWNASTQLGCDRAPCMGKGVGFLWTCHYNPPGNFLGEVPYAKDPCFRVACPSSSKCIASFDRPVCTCPAGQALVNRVCVKNPCVGKVCPATQTCTGTSGKPVCGCGLGTVRSKINPAQCVPSVCQSVRCPTGSRCRAVSGTPVCSCAAGFRLVNNACVKGPGKLYATSIAIYNAPNYGGAPAVLRVPVNQEGCAQLHPAYRGAVKSFKVVRNVADPGASAGSTTVLCKILYFWSNPGCTGAGFGPFVNFGPTTNYPSTSGNMVTGASVSCSV